MNASHSAFTSDLSPVSSLPITIIVRGCLSSFAASMIGHHLFLRGTVTDEAQLDQTFLSNATGFRLGTRRRSDAEKGRRHSKVAINVPVDQK